MPASPQTDMNTRNVQKPELYTYTPALQPKWMIFHEIAIMTVTFNRLTYTQKLIDSLYQRTHLPFTLYIFDQASTDGTTEYLDTLCQTHPNIVLKKFKKNIGKGRAYLQAKKEVRGDFLVCFDNDLEILSNYWLVHLLKAYYAYFLQTGNTDIALGLRAINLEEYGFRFSKTLETFKIPTAANSLPRTSYSACSHQADPQHALDERVCLGYTDHLWGGVWSLPIQRFKQIKWEECYPNYIGGVDTFSSKECQRLHMQLGYIENGPIVRHNDWPYTEEKIQTYTQLRRQRTVLDRHYVIWKVKDLLKKFRQSGARSLFV
jgi:glycosyltransferase involved in cell wall biosynthesis